MSEVNGCEVGGCQSWFSSRDQDGLAAVLFTKIYILTFDRAVEEQAVAAEVHQ